MNIVMDDAAEVYVKDAKPRREIGLWHTLTSWDSHLDIVYRANPPERR